MLQVLCVLLFYFFIAPSGLKGEVKVVFVDGPLESGAVRSIRGVIVEETPMSITIRRSNGTLTIGRNFIIKIENWDSSGGRRR